MSFFASHFALFTEVLCFVNVDFKSSDINEDVLLPRITLTYFSLIQRSVRCAKMATVTTVLSTSSFHSPIAATPPRFQAVTMSSSPNLPSPSQLFSSLPSQLPIGSRAAPIPKDANTGFASASTLLRQARFEGRGEYESSAKRLGLAKSCVVDCGSSPVLTEVKTVAEKENEIPPCFKKPKTLLGEQSAIPQTNMECAEARLTKSVSKTAEGSAPKKPRKKKSKEEGDGQTKIKKTKITKPGNPKKPDKPSQKAETVEKPNSKQSETFNTLLPPQEEDARAREEFRDLCIEKAIPLRRQWTPCKDIVQKCSPEDTLDAPIGKDPPIARFGQLLGDFGLAKTGVTCNLPPKKSGHDTSEVAFKRRKIEIVQGVPAPPQVEQQKRTKSPKKKPRTITETAIAPFVPTVVTAEPSLLEYFEACGASNPPAEKTQADHNYALSTTRRKSAVKKAPDSKAVKVRTITQRQPILLSPESAMKKAGNQEIVFGTSSQLAREDSPTLIKNIRQTIEDLASMSQEWESSVLPVGKFRTSNSMAVTRPRNLWSFASRDLENSLLEAEVVDLSETPKPAKDQGELVPPSVKPYETELQLCHEQETESQDVTSSIVEQPELNLQPTPVLQQEQEPNRILPRSVAEATLRKRPDNRSAVKNATNIKADSNQMPNYHGFSDTELSKEVKAYGFKTIKKRVAMITLLEECWESKITMARQEAEANLNAKDPAMETTEGDVSVQDCSSKKRGRPPKKSMPSDTAAESIEVTPTKKPRGRPRKEANATTPPAKRKQKVATTKKVQPEVPLASLDDIYDSSPPTPSPPRRRTSSKSPRQLQLSPSKKASISDKPTAPKEDRSYLFEQITKAVKSSPPTNDPNNLTFNEKILMYEPVVLEDLAVWLNTQALASVDEDGEVEPGLVKEWCEERSVCCLWRENLRGGLRGRW